MQRSLIVGTAGHIDHGKTALVRALTGVDTDRLIEEKRRGITIELGFAHLQLQDTSFGIVDVPGHEKFIKSMVAGAGGIDLAILVVAADEGIMPQTREHLDICNLLGVRRGMVALTKSDLVDAEWLALVTDDLGQALEGSFLEGAPIVCCSATTGDGIDDIKATLLELSLALPQRDADGALRLPLDRVFTMKGFGTVVTGTLLGGTIAPGDEVAVLPSAVLATVRRVQVHGQDAPHAQAGQRTAINLGGVDREEVARGEVIAAPDTLAPSSIIDVKITLLEGARKALKARSRVLFHLGTRQQEASCVLLQAAEGRLEPGGEALAQLRFERGVVALPGDRFILRGFVKQDNYGTTVGGGEVLRVLAPKLRPRNHEAIALLQRMATADEDTRLELEVLAAGASGIRRLELQRRLPLNPRRLKQRLERLREAGTVMRFDREHEGVIHREHAAALREQLLQIVDRFHREHPLREGVGKAEVHSRLRPPIDARLLFFLLQGVQRDGELVLEQEICRRPKHRAQVDASLGPVAERVADLYAEAGLGPPRETELSAMLAPEKPTTITAAVRRLLGDGTLVKVGPLLFHQRPLESLATELQRFLTDQGEITPSQFKGLVGQSRKFTIPLAEHFDARGLTVRVGDIRRLR